MGLATHNTYIKQKHRSCLIVAPVTPAKKLSQFQKDWPYVSTVKTHLNADKCKMVENGTFGTGRVKYDAVFYSVREDGSKTELSRHVAWCLL